MFGRIVCESTIMLLLLSVRNCRGYCMGIGSNPDFSGPPIVRQVNITTVLVSWKEVAVQPECADQYRVKVGPTSSPSQYEMTDLLTPDSMHAYIYKRIPEVEYYYVAIAREDKGWVRGIEYNRSPRAFFTTSLRNDNMDPVAIISEVAPSPQSVPEATAEINAEDQQVATGSSSVAVRGRGGVFGRGEKVVDEKVGWFDTEEVIWICVGVLAVVIIIIGIVYNLIRRNKPEKDLELESDVEGNLDGSIEDEPHEEAQQIGEEDTSDEEEGDQNEATTLKGHKRSGSFFKAKSDDD